MGDEDEKYQIILVGEIEVWRELAFWDNVVRFNEIKALLKQRYGTRFKSLTPTDGWIGKGEKTFPNEGVLECPRCDHGVAYVQFPSLRDTEQAAVAGNEEAIRDLPEERERIRRLEARMNKFWSNHLHSLEQLPNDLPHTSHADQLVEIGRDVFGRGDSFVQKITGKVERPLQHIREFRNRPQPSVVVSVDLLTTGVDIPDLEGIVFLRPVKSRILFEQMLGRGTRKGEHFPDKSHFVVFDCFDGTLLEYFKNATEITAEPPEHEVRTITEIIEDIWNNRDRDYNIHRLVKRLQRIDKEMSGEARDMFAAFIPQGDLAKYASDLPRQLRTDFVERMKLLREKSFQDLLVNYPRRQRTFLVATDTVDVVSSSWLVRGTDGKEYKPEDYLSVFARFVRENPAQVEAIRILLNRPRDWNTAALTELRQKLAIAPQRFTFENLRKAHEIHYHKALVDIISMVKHAANEQEPLYTAGDRVKLAMARMTTGKSFTPEQIQWLDRIEAHLVENLTIEQEDFEAVPVFNLAGGWSRANRVFDGKLPQMIKQLNEAIAS